MVRFFTHLFLILIFTVLSVQVGVAGEFFGKEGGTGIKIYPNPMNTEATVRIDDAVDFESGKVSFVIYNVVGKEVYRLSAIKSKEFKLTRENLVPGLYFYQLIDNNKVISTGRISVK
ncbi:MAG: T9SS type A sorting domain-containing protein [Chitinophagales bacterium]|nr:T9SS type A sorting domain-containing protein [Chitinophagales bacterium]